MNDAYGQVVHSLQLEGWVRMKLMPEPAKLNVSHASLRCEPLPKLHPPKLPAWHFCRPSPDRLFSPQFSWLTRIPGKTRHSAAQ